MGLRQSWWCVESNKLKVVHWYLVRYTRVYFTLSSSCNCSYYHCQNSHIQFYFHEICKIQLRFFMLYPITSLTCKNNGDINGADADDDEHNRVVLDYRKFFVSFPVLVGEMHSCKHTIVQCILILQCDKVAS